MKKREVKPFLSIETKDTIYKISYVTGHSVKRICEEFCKHSFKSGLAFELSPYFNRSICIDGTSFEGSQNNEKFEPLSLENERVSMTLDANVHEYAYQLSYAIGCSVAKVVAYAIEKSMCDFDFLNQYTKELLINNRNFEKSKPILKIIDSYNRNNEEEINLITLLLYIADEYTRLEVGMDDVLKDCVSN